MLRDVTIQVTRIQQGKWEFHIGSMRASDLVQICHSDTIRLSSLKPREYEGMQRPLDEKRVSSIRQYLTEGFKVMPTSIVLAVNSEYVREWRNDDGAAADLVLTANENAAAIIDGQHRVAALSAVPDGDFLVPVTIFVDPDMETRAKLFTSINANQKPVNPSLTYQLFGYAKTQSPQKTAHEVAKILNNIPNSPLHGRIKMVVGLRDDWSKGGTVTQATFANELLKLVTKSKQADENLENTGRTPEDDPELPLRKYYVGRKNDEMAVLLGQYFRCIRRTWPEQWDDPESNLVRSTGVAALLRALRVWMLARPADFERGALSDVMSRIEPSRAVFGQPDHRFVSTNYASNSAHQDMLRDALLHHWGIVPGPCPRCEAKP